MATDFDAVVIGSGFGGAVSALRLAEGGYRVLVLERGRRWHRLEYPSVTRSDWLWDEAHPERTNGWLDIRNHGNIATVAGAGVGGGSLHFANVEPAPASAAARYTSRMLSSTHSKIFSAPVGPLRSIFRFWRLTTRR